MNAKEKFVYKKYTDEERWTVRGFMTDLQMVAERIDTLPDSDEKTLAIRKLQETHFWIQCAVTGGRS